jgi:hypothetical protein
MSEEKTKQRNPIKILGITLVIFAVLVATHLGEFWPFSIYPMFSQGGRTWTRALVRDVANVPDSLVWQTTGFNDLPGKPVVLPDYGVDQIDYSNFMSKTKEWDAKRVQALRDMFKEENLQGSKWLAMKVSGQLEGADSVVVEALPFWLLTADSSYKNPNLPPETYFKKLKP